MASMAQLANRTQKNKTMQKKVRSLRLYLVSRFIIRPYQVLVIAESQKDAETISNKRYGPDNPQVTNARIMRGKTFVLDTYL